MLRGLLVAALAAAVAGRPAAAPQHEYKLVRIVQVDAHNPSVVHHVQPPENVLLTHRLRHAPRRRRALPDSRVPRVQSLLERARTVDAPLMPEGTVYDAPDPLDKETMVQLALMSSNAYYESEEAADGEWREIDPVWNETLPFGFDADGTRGQIYALDDGSVVVIAIKGTSAEFLGVVGGETSENDKINDNTMFSCCCARVDFTWTTVCDCYDGDKRCSQSCLEDACAAENLYYNDVIKIYEEVAPIFPPTTRFMFTGHSLGGALGSIGAISTGWSAVAFQSPGDRLFADRLGFDTSEDAVGNYDVMHFGSTSDPFFTGKCKGVASTCYVAGYAIETGCHIGQACVYDGGPRNPTTHFLRVAIEKFYMPEPLPDCAPQLGCVDCEEWEFV